MASSKVKSSQKKAKTAKQIRVDDERWFHFAMQNASDIITVFDESGKILYQSPSVLRVLGYHHSREGANIFHSPLVHPEDQKRKNAFLRKLIAARPDTELKGEFRMHHANGSWRDIEAVGINLLHLPDLKGVVLSSREITERKQAERAIQESEERSRLAQQAGNIGTYDWDLATGKIVFSAQAEKIFGYRAGRLKGDYGHAVKLIHPADRVHARQVSQAAIKGRHDLDLEYRIVRPNKVVRWVHIRGNIVYDAAKTPAKLLGVVIDITERKQDEENRRRKHEMERRMDLLTQQRNTLLKINKTKDEFIALASHQLRTPATAVKQYVGLLQSGFLGPLTSEQLRFLQIAYDSNERELGIIDDLLKTAQIDSARPQLDKELCDIVELLRESIAELQPTFDQKKQAVTLDASKKSSKVRIDPTDMKLVFTNLLENASKYSFPAAPVTVKLRHKDKQVEIAVTDKGVGIDPENQRRIFDKFTRVDNELSDTVMGTGLGLYWVKQIVELHHGTVKLTSRLGKGSTFTLRLPCE